MSAAGASPAQLDELAVDLRRYAGALAPAGLALQRAVEVTPAAMAVGRAALAAVGDASRGMGELGRGFDDLARFVAQVAEALRAADSTLERAGGAPAGDGTWRTVGDASGRAQWRAYAGGVRRTFSGTVSDPFRPERRRTTIRRDGSVQDGFGDLEMGVALWSASRTASRGTGAASRRGGDAAHVDLAAFAGGQATGTVTTAVSGGQAQAAVSARVLAGAAASATGRLGNEYAGLEAGAAAFGGALAEGEVQAGIGREGLDVEVTARAFVGGEVETSAAVEVLGVRGAGHAGVSYGLGAELEADVEVGLDEVAFTLDLGATFGLGVSFGVDVRVSPRDVSKKSVKLAKSAWRKLT